MSENFMSAITQIEDLIRKKGQILEKTASLIAEAILDRIQSGTLSRNTEKDIKNAIQNFNKDEQVEILSKALVFVGMNNKTSRDSDDRRSEPNKKKIRERSDIFGRYND